ncbi:ECF transporter S component [Fusobacterium sp. THCT1E2]
MGKRIKRENDPLYLYKFSIMIAIELLLAFSPLGYIEMKPFTVTLMHIPVIAGAFFLGPFEGMVLGGIFGLTSMWKASILGVAYTDHIFSPFISGTPLSSTILSMGTRMAFGFLSGILFEVVKWNKYKKTAIAVITVISAYIHSFLVYTVLYFLFPNLGMTPLSTFTETFKLNNIIYVTTSVGALLTIYTISNSEKIKEFQRQIRIVEMSERKEKNNKILLVFTGIIIIVVMSLSYHFFTRMKMVLVESGVILSQSLLKELLHIGMQFSISSISLIFLIMVVLIFVRKYSKEMEFRSELDIMTGIYNKGTIITHIKEKLKKSDDTYSKAFIILDVDYFKTINDSYGHLFGDMVLIKVAEILMNLFRKSGIVGRFGGDEFCILLYNAYYIEHLEEYINKLRQQINEIDIPDEKGRKITCSIGISFCQGNRKTFEKLCHEADTALYTVKSRGRDGYAFWEDK